MKSQQPKITLQQKPIDKLLKGISIVILLFGVGYLILKYNTLPNVIPVHFNGSGIPDRWASKWQLWLLPLISTILLLGLFYLMRFPHKLNYLQTITQDNALKQYTLAVRLLQLLTLYIQVLFAFLIYKTIAVATDKVVGLGNYFLVLLITVSLLLFIWHALMSFKNA